MKKKTANSKSKTRTRKKSITRRRKFTGGEDRQRIVFIFTIVGGEIGNEDNWEVYPANLLTNLAKKKFQVGAKYQLADIQNIDKDHLLFSFTERGLVVTSSLSQSNSTDDVVDDIKNTVEVINDKSIWQTVFDKNERRHVESTRKYYKFSQISIES